MFDRRQTSGPATWPALTLTVLMLAGGGVTACGGKGEGGSTPDTTAPFVTATSPGNNATDVPSNSVITVTFSEAVDPATVTPVAMSIRSGFNTRAGTITYAGTTATFTPNAALESGAMYTVHVTPDVTDVAGNALPVDYFWTFTTAPPPDTTAPTVVLTNPVDGATSVSSAGAVMARFSEPVDPASVTQATFLVGPGGGASIPGGIVSYDPGSVTATFALPPGQEFENNGTYTARLTADIADPVGNHLATDVVWTFTVEPFPDRNPPEVVATNPIDDADRVPISGAVTARFNEALKPSTVNAATFVVGVQGGGAVAGTVSYDEAGFAATFSPTTAFQSGTTYEARLTAGVTDASDNPLAADYVWSFTIIAPRFAFVANSEADAISIFGIDPGTGALNAQGAAGAGDGPSSVGVDSNGRFVYAANQLANTVTAFRFNSTTAVLEEVGVSFAGMAPSALAVDRTGRFIYTTNRNSGNVSIFSMDQAPETLQRIGFVSTNTTPVSITVHPSGLFAYVASQGGGVSRFQIDQNTGVLFDGQVATAGTQPIAVTVDPSGRFAYTVNRLSADVTTFSVDPATGLLTEVGTEVPTGSSPVSVAVDPSGRFVYVANRGSNNVSMFRINQTTGALAAIAAAVAAGTQPSAVVVDPSGQFVYVTNLASDDVTVFRINQTTGALVQPASIAVGDGPASIAVIGSSN